MAIKQVEVIHDRCSQQLVCPTCGVAAMVTIDLEDWAEGTLYAPTVQLPWVSQERDHTCASCGLRWRHRCDFSRQPEPRHLP